MCQICENRVNGVWESLKVGQSFRTPDLYKGANFSIKEKFSNKIKISPQNVSISKKSFSSTIHFLLENKHSFNNPCEVRSSNDRSSAGPLCIVSRDQNSNVRCINYILPILQENRLVGIDQGRPNKTWLL